VHETQIAETLVRLETKFGFKMPIYAPFWVFFGGTRPQIEHNINQSPQKLNLRVITVL